MNFIQILSWKIKRSKHISNQKNNIILQITIQIAFYHFAAFVKSDLNNFFKQKKNDALKFFKVE